MASKDYDKHVKDNRRNLSEAFLRGAEKATSKTAQDNAKKK